MRPGLSRLAAPLALLVGAAAAGADDAPAPTDAACWECHEGASRSREIVSPGRVDSLDLTAALAAGSVHGGGGLACVDCHAGIGELPHAEELPAVRCDACHADETAQHVASVHGAAVAAGNSDAPGCTDCHGTHAILTASDAASPTHSTLQPATCARCHADPAVVERNDIPAAAPLDAYAASVHGEALRSGGDARAPTCATCHGAHDVRRSTDPESRVAKAHVPGTCGACHAEVAAVFRESVHGEAVARGNPDAPACNDCHGEHGIQPTASPTSLVYPDNIVRTTCVRCHESEVLAQRYGFKADRSATFRETYHGLASQLGGLPVANCASCHGVHDIFRSSDPRSTIHPSHLQATCGRCHPDASAAFTQIAVHEPATVVPKHPVTRLTRAVYVALIVVVVGGMALHNALAWLSYVVRKWRRERAEPRVARFSRFEVVEHMILAIVFFGLALTGFALKYSSSGWVHWLTHVGLDEAVRSSLHRFLGAALIGVGIAHTTFLVGTRRGRADLLALRPRLHDVREFLGTLKFYIGRRAEKPRAGRFDYAEKVEYLALLWGTGVMAVTGLVLWYPAVVTRWAPAWLVEVSEVVHFYEAWLAFLAILIWHFFFVMLHPDEAPLNTTVLDGMVTLKKARERDGEGEGEGAEVDADASTGADPDAGASSEREGKAEPDAE